MRVAEAVKRMREQGGRGVVGASRALGRHVELVRDGERLGLEAEWPAWP